MKLAKSIKLMSAKYIIASAIRLMNREIYFVKRFRIFWRCSKCRHRRRGIIRYVTPSFSFFWFLSFFFTGFSFFCIGFFSDTPFYDLFFWSLLFAVFLMVGIFSTISFQCVFRILIFFAVVLVLLCLFAISLLTILQKVFL